MIDADAACDGRRGLMKGITHQSLIIDVVWTKKQCK